MHDVGKLLSRTHVAPHCLRTCKRRALAPTLSSPTWTSWP